LRGIRFSHHNQLEYESYIFMGVPLNLEDRGDLLVSDS
jgi:hypothetical protein